MHVTECVFFKRTPVGDHEFVYELWSRDFWKIRAFAKEKKNETRADTGSLIQANLETKGEKNRLVSFKLRKNVSSERMDYSAAVEYLKVISALSKTLPEGVPNAKLYEQYRDSLPYFENGECRKASAIFLSKLAITLWTHRLGPEASENLKRFDSAVATYDVDTLHKIKGVDQSLVEEALTAAELALARYHF